MKTRYLLHTAAVNRKYACEILCRCNGASSRCTCASTGFCMAVPWAESVAHGREGGGVHSVPCDPPPSPLPLPPGGTYHWAPDVDDPVTVAVLNVESQMTVAAPGSAVRVRTPEGPRWQGGGQPLLV